MTEYRDIALLCVSILHTPALQVRIHGIHGKDNNVDMACSCRLGDIGFFEFR